MPKPTKMACHLHNATALLERLSLTTLPQQRQSSRRLLPPSTALLRCLSTKTATDNTLAPPLPSTNISSESRPTKRPHSNTPAQKKTKPRHATVLHAGTMRKTIKVRSFSQRYDRKLRKNYAFHETMLCRDDEGIAREGDVVEVVKWPREDRTDDQGRLKASERVVWKLKGVVTPFGTPVEEREKLWEKQEKQADEREELDEGMKRDVERFAREATAESRADPGLMAQGLRNEIQAEERAQEREEKEGVSMEVRKKADQVDQ